MGMNPVAWRGASGGEATIKELTATELRELAYRVLSKVANTDGVGTVNVSTNTTLTLIGSFEDTYRGANNVGDSNVQIGSATYEFRQNLTTDYPESVPPNFYYTANSASPLVEASASVYETLANNILYYCTVDEGPNSYRIGTSGAPATTYGGSWTTVATIDDYFYRAVAGLSTPQYLYKRVDDGGYTPQRPLKPGAAAGTLNQFTDTDITNIARIVRQRIKDTGLATYSLGTTAPPTGTWTAVGTIIDTISDAQGTFTASYAGPDTYTTAYTSDVTYTGDYFGPVDYATAYASDSTYFGPQTFSIAYFGTANYTNDYFGPGPAYTSTYYGPQNINFNYYGPSTTPAVFSSEGPTFTLFVTYTGLGFSSDATPFAGTNYIGPSPEGVGLGFYGTYYGPDRFYGGAGTTNYTGDNVTIFYATYYGPTQYTGELLFVGPATYTGPFPYVGDDAQPFSLTYFGPAAFSTPVPATYLGPAGFTGTYFGPATFSAPPTPVTYLGPASFAGTNPNATPFTSGPFPSYVGPKGTFTRSPQTYLGPGPATFINPNGAPFVGSVPGPSFINPNGNPVPETFINPNATPFTGSVPGTSYVGDNVNPFSTSYAGPATFFGDSGPYVSAIAPYYGSTSNYLGAPLDGNIFYTQNYYGPEFGGAALVYVGDATYLGGPADSSAFYSISYAGTEPFSANYFGPGSLPVGYNSQFNYTQTNSFFGSVTNPDGAGPYVGTTTFPDNLPFNNSFINVDGALFSINYTGDDSVVTIDSYTGDNVNAFVAPDVGPAFVSSYTAEDAGGPFTSAFISSDTGTAFNTGYLNDDAIQYSAAYTSQLSNYVNTPTAPFTSVLGTATTLITKYLWRRIA